MTGLCGTDPRHRLQQSWQQLVQVGGPTALAERASASPCAMLHAAVYLEASDSLLCRTTHAGTHACYPVTPCPPPPSPMQAGLLRFVSHHRPALSRQRCWSPPALRRDRRLRRLLQGLLRTHLHRRLHRHPTTVRMLVETCARTAACVRGASLPPVLLNPPAPNPCNPHTSPITHRSYLHAARADSGRALLPKQ